MEGRNLALPALPADLDPFYLDVTDDATASTANPTSEIDIRPQIERLFGKRPREVSTSHKPEVEFQSLAQLPELALLGKKVTVTSQEDFTWLTEIDAVTEISGLEAASQGLDPTDPKLRIYSASTYWSAGNLDTERWLAALRTLYFSFLYEKCPYLYVDFKRYLSVFKREAGEPVAIVSPASKHLKDLLASMGVLCESDRKGDETEEVEVMDMVKRRPGKSLGRRLLIKGKNVHCFYNYLVNEPEEGTIYSPVPFLYGTMKALETTFAGEVQTEQGVQYRLSLEGVILPSKLHSLLSLLHSTQHTFTLDLDSDSRSTPFASLTFKSLRMTPTSLYLQPF